MAAGCKWTGVLWLRGFYWRCLSFIIDLLAEEKFLLAIIMFGAYTDFYFTYSPTIFGRITKPILKGIGYVDTRLRNREIKRNNTIHSLSRSTLKVSMTITCFPPATRNNPHKQAHDRPTS
jgi:hypothetical protein